MVVPHWEFLIPGRNRDKQFPLRQYFRMQVG
jgi:hypothetical protein